MPDLSVVIVSYNTRELLRSCLLSLRASQGLALDIIVVDNASHDGSVAMLQRDFPDVRALPQRQNTWYCGGNNIGIRAAEAELVLLLNPDTEVAPDALARMVQFLRRQPDYAGATAQLRYPDGSIQPTCARIPSYAYLLLNYSILGTLFRAARQRQRDTVLYAGWPRESDRDVEVLPGACTLMRQRDIRLDEDLRLYFPEEALAQKTRGRFRYLSAARITHHEKSSTGDWRARQNFFRDMLVYCRKQHGWARTLLLWLCSRPLLALQWLRWNVG